MRQYRVTSSTGAGTSVPSALTAAVPTRLVLITAGQSNATGWESYAVDPKTGIDYLAAPFTNGADAADLITWMPWGIRKGLGATPVPLDTPQPKSPTQAIFGPELGLARQLWADRQVPLTIIKAPCPGTSLAVNWNPAVTTGHPPDALYMRLVAKVLATLAADAHAGTLDVLGGVYWFQGESDIKNAANAASYQGNLATLIGRLRNDLPLAPSAPIVVPAPAHNTASLHAIVQSAGLSWVETDPERVANAMANQRIVPIKLGRERKPLVVISDAPLVQVETRT